MRRLTAVIAVVAALALAASAHAQMPTPTAEPELRAFPYGLAMTARKPFPPARQ